MHKLGDSKSACANFLKGLIVLMPDDIFSKLYPAKSAGEMLSPFYNPERESKPEHEKKEISRPSMDITPFPKETPVAMGYVPFQQWGSTLTPEAALEAGTLFPELDRPFLGRMV